MREVGGLSRCNCESWVGNDVITVQSESWEPGVGVSSENELRVGGKEK